MISILAYAIGKPRESYTGQLDEAVFIICGIMETVVWLFLTYSVFWK